MSILSQQRKLVFYVVLYLLILMMYHCIQWCWLFFWLLCMYAARTRLAWCATGSKPGWVDIRVICSYPPRWFWWFFMDGFTTCSFSSTAHCPTVLIEWKHFPIWWLGKPSPWLRRWWNLLGCISSFISQVLRIFVLFLLLFTFSPADWYVFFVLSM